MNCSISVVLPMPGSPAIQTTARLPLHALVAQQLSQRQGSLEVPSLYLTVRRFATAINRGR